MAEKLVELLQTTSPFIQDSTITPVDEQGIITISIPTLNRHSNSYLDSKIHKIAENTFDVAFDFAANNDTQHISFTPKMKSTYNKNHLGQYIQIISFPRQTKIILSIKNKNNETELYGIQRGNYLTFITEVYKLFSTKNQD